MNIFNKVTLQSLKKNKTRTVVTIIGIILSAAMICAVTTFVSSIYNYALENAVYIDGDWHGNALDTDWETYKKIIDSDEVESAVYAQQLGYAVVKGCENEYKPYFYILGGSEGFSEKMPVHITSGTYPATENEIILPEHLWANGGVKYEIGDILHLDIGDRVSDGFSLGQRNPFLTEEEGGEELQIRESRSYKVVGFYERPSFEDYSAPGYTAITVADSESQDTYSYNVWFKMANPKDIYSYMENNQISGEPNTSVLTYSGVSNFDNFYTMITGLAAIVIGLIVFGSISLIYNAFSISVSERTKQFGLLSSVGATRKQLRKMVIFEALVVSVIGIPLGVLAGIGGIGVTLLFIGDKFQDIFSNSITLSLSVSPVSVAVAVVIALVTVLISAWIPSKRATNISAVEAIRQNVDVNARGKMVKTSKLTYKLFGLPGMLANKYYKRSRKKYRATVLSLFMSIVLFVSASAFTDYLMESVSEGYGTDPYDLRFLCSENNFADMSKEQLLKLLKEDKGVTNAAYTKVNGYMAEIKGKYLTEKAAENLDSVKIQPEDTAYVSSMVCFVNDAAYKELIAEYNLNENLYMDAENPLAIVVDGNTSFSISQEKFINMKILESEECEALITFQKEFEDYYYYGLVENENGLYVHRYISKENGEAYMDIPEEEVIEKSAVKIGKIIYDLPYFTDNYQGLTFIYPESLLDNAISGLGTDRMTFRFLFTSDDHKASYKAIAETLDENGFNGINVVDYVEIAEENRNMIVIVQVFAYGFIVLISLIAAANVFNTISTNISLRRREFAMLKSVGMTAKGFNKMMNFECLLYGSRALLYGLPVSVGITYLIYLAISEGYSTGFRLPWVAIGIAVFSVFAVVFVTMMYSMSKIKKDNPIDALKNENL